MIHWFAAPPGLWTPEKSSAKLTPWLLRVPETGRWINGIQDLAPKTRRETTTNWEIFGKQNGHKLQLPGVRKTPKLLKISSEFQSKNWISHASCYQTSSINSNVFFQKDISDSAAQTFAIFSVCKPATIKDLSGEISILWSEASSKKHWGLWEDRPWRLASWCLRWLTRWTRQVPPPPWTKRSRTWK